MCYRFNSQIQSHAVLVYLCRHITSSRKRGEWGGERLILTKYFHLWIFSQMLTSLAFFFLVLPEWWEIYYSPKIYVRQHRLPKKGTKRKHVLIFIVVCHTISYDCFLFSFRISFSRSKWLRGHSFTSHSFHFVFCFRFQYFLFFCTI